MIEPTTPATSRPLGTIAALCGGLLVLASLCGVVAYLGVPFQRAQNALENNTVLASIVAMCLVFGGILLVSGLASARGRHLPDLYLPPPWVFITLFGVVLLVGQGILFANFATAYLFPPWHVLASAMLPLAVLAGAVRRLPPTTAPVVWGEFVWGGMGTVLLALVLEIVVGVLVALGAMLVLVAVIGPEQLVALARSISTAPRDPERILSLLSSQPAALIIAGSAAVAFLVGLVPLIEETLKALGPAVLIARRKPAATTALLWGIAAGAGYAFSENLLNGAGGVNAPREAPLWVPAMILRAGTSLVHIATTATVSLGWYHVFVDRRRAQFALCLGAALAAHGFWNVIALALGAAITSAGMAGDAAELGGASALMAMAALLILFLLIFGAALWIAGLLRWANRHAH